MDEKEILKELHQAREKLNDMLVSKVDDIDKRVAKNEKFILRATTVFGTILFILEVLPKIDKLLLIIDK